MPTVGQSVADRYVLDEHFVTGFSGQVWKATDTRLKRAVAVKLLHTETEAGKRFRARFATEATIVAALSAPNVATVHDYGEEPDGEGITSYLVMEWISGRSLAAILQSSRTLPVEETVRIITEAANGLDEAHRAGVVHRDVKPANILVTEDGSVKLIDFGIAGAGREPGLDGNGRITGTPQYMAPEQVANRTPEPAVDTYALGIVAYECLTGNPPFNSDTPMMVLNSHLARAPEHLPDHIPGKIADAVMKALRKRPNQRWGSVAEFAAALRPEPEPEAVAIGVVEPPDEIAAATTTALQRLRRSFGPQTVGALTIVVLLVIGLAMFWPWGATTPDTRDTSRDRPAETQNDEPESSATEDNSGMPPDDGKEPGEPEERPEEENSESPGDDDPKDGITVPNLIGESTYTATATVRRAGFNSVTGKPMSGDGKDCVITRQTPSAGSKASPSTMIVVGYPASSYGCGLEFGSTSVEDNVAVNANSSTVERTSRRSGRKPRLEP